jgi:hypothetical protein
MRREQERHIQALLNTLSPHDRSVLVMRYWYNLSYEEIAAATTFTVSAVKSRLHRARSALAGVIGQSQDADAPGLRHLQRSNPALTPSKAAADPRGAASSRGSFCCPSAAKG